LGYLSSKAANPKKTPYPLPPPRVSILVVVKSTKKFGLQTAFGMTKDLPPRPSKLSLSD